MSNEPDVLVIGGGPAGASVATLVKKYTPGARVVVCEQEAYPRHHIGESFVADINRLLADMDVYEKIKKAGFIRKRGSTFIWGRDRTPWTIEFSNLGAIPGFSDGAGYDSSYTWHVQRHVYDKILLDHAREMGAEVLQPASAEIQFDDANEVQGVKLSDGRVLHPRYVIDATGQHNQISRRMKTREYDPELRNIAIYGYYQGAELNPALSGNWEDTRIAVITVPDGWIWYIPVAKDLVSVGVVTSRDALTRRGNASVRDYYESTVQGCVEVAPLLKNATRIVYGGSDTDIHTIKDYCYSVSKLYGRGWALCGDASGFVDPILSIGCYLAHSGGSRLAYTLNTLLSGAPVDEALAWRAYEEQLRYSLSAFRRMTYMFYAFNDGKESWWWEAKKILRERALPQSVDGPASFLALATGYGINRPVTHEAISDFGVNIFDSFTQNLIQPGTIKAQVDLGRGRVFRRTTGFHAEPWVVPIQGTGKLHPVMRVTFDGRGEDSPLPARLFLPSTHWRFVDALHERTAEQALGLLPRDEAELLRPQLPSFLTGLVNLGVMSSSAS